MNRENRNYDFLARLEDTIPVIDSETDRIDGLLLQKCFMTAFRDGAGGWVNIRELNATSPSQLRLEMTVHGAFITKDMERLEAGEAEKVWSALNEKLMAAEKRAEEAEKRVSQLEKTLMAVKSAFSDAA